MMDPVIKGLSFDSPCRPSLGNALLINPERRKKNIITLLKKEHKHRFTFLNTYYNYPQIGLHLCQNVPC